MTAAVILRVLCALAALVILVTVAERMFPLRSVARDRWEWELRPAGRFPRIDRAGWAQVAVFTVLGAGIGGLLRLAVGLCRPRRLSAVLANGTTRAMATASHQLFDSESAADIYAATWLRDAPVRSRRIRGPVLPALMLRRILRRGYIPLLSVTVALVAAALGPAAGAWGRGLLILCWAVPAAAVWRATRLRIPGEGWWRAALLMVTAGLGAGMLLLTGVPASPVPAVAAAVVTVLVGGLLRGRPRINDDFGITETGLFSIPTGMLGYWASGWIAVVPAVVAAVTW